MEGQLLSFKFDFISSTDSEAEPVVESRGMERDNSQSRIERLRETESSKSCWPLRFRFCFCFCFCCRCCCCCCFSSSSCFCSSSIISICSASTSSAVMAEQDEVDEDSDNRLAAASRLFADRFSFLISSFINKILSSCSSCNPSRSSFSSLVSPFLTSFLA